MIISEGFHLIGNLHIYYKLCGPKEPFARLLTVHGGPGMSHDYMLPLSALAERGVEVLFYDQGGSGRSEELSDISHFAINSAVEEVEGMRRATFGNQRVFLLGSSYGGFIVLAYALKYQHRLQGLIVSNGLCSYPFFLKDVKRLRKELPLGMRRTLERYEARGEFDSPEYLRAARYFSQHHFLRLRRWPEEVNRSIAYAKGRTLFRALNGPTGTVVTGPLKDWDITEQIKTIHVPTLILVGKHDEVSPRNAQMIRRNLRDSKLVLLGKSSHLPMWEETDLYLNSIEQFINGIAKGHSRATRPLQAS